MGEGRPRDILEQEVLGRAEEVEAPMQAVGSLLGGWRHRRHFQCRGIYRACWKLERLRREEDLQSPRFFDHLMTLELSHLLSLRALSY